MKWLNEVSFCDFKSKSLEPRQYTIAIAITHINSDVPICSGLVTGFRS